ncbi:BICD family-like cargo adapter 2 isoform X2 [Homalodisca vitripennis]|uniref:BICD family-like cargo adapter 2 isoform X2 n=1 Tax=Homalodisca vitripennis TaxID=197043 RepID=UPI001EEC61E6|nr:BICD family-like cargo adapter 2 isoform X2 [Homalodisca vitripennis]
MTSPVSELLVQDSLCKDLFKTISESVELSNSTDPELGPPEHYSGDVIGQLLDRMVQILPPEERNIFGDAEEKNIEDIIEEANELIRATTPLFSSSESGEKSWNKSSRTLSKPLKTSETSLKKDYSEEFESSTKDKSENDSICSSMESILVKENVSNTALPDDGESPLKHENPKEIHVNKDCVENKYKEDTNDIKTADELPIKAGLKMTSDLKNVDHVQNKIQVNLSSGVEKHSDFSQHQQKSELGKTLQFQNVKEIDTEVFIKDKSLKTNTNEQLELETQLLHMKNKYIAEIQELKQLHNKEVHELNEQLSRFNIKIYELQKSSKAEKSPEVNSQQLECLQNEIKSQEQLITGYERENKKLCKEISSLKEVWKQRETKLIEEKQKLQNQLQGMVSKTTTEALEEQLKDARETIVKLQIELTTYKSKSKELEVTCERLRSETHRLQAELSKCRCDRSVGRRDKYSFLASSNVGTQIQELKNVISRKDIEIAQMSTTLGVLKGELGGREGSMYSQQLESHNLTISQLQAALAVERQTVKDLVHEKEMLLKENLDLKRQVRELESIVKRRQRSESCFPVISSETQSSSRLVELEKELSSRQESLSALHTQFLNMQKKYEDHIQELEERLKECREEIITLKANQKKEDANQLKSNAKRLKQSTAVVKEETHLLATIRGLRQEVSTREKEITKLTKEIEEVRLTNKRLQKEREKQLNSMPVKMSHIREKTNLRKVDKTGSAGEPRSVTTSPNNNINPLLFAELQESNLILKSKTKSLQEEVKRLEQDLIAMHNKRVHDMS